MLSLFKGNNQYDHTGFAQLFPPMMLINTDAIRVMSSPVWPTAAGRSSSYALPEPSVAACHHKHSQTSCGHRTPAKVARRFPSTLMLRCSAAPVHHHDINAPIPRPINIPAKLSPISATLQCLPGKNGSALEDSSMTAQSTKAIAFNHSGDVGHAIVTSTASTIYSRTCAPRRSVPSFTPVMLLSQRDSSPLGPPGTCDRKIENRSHRIARILKNRVLTSEEDINPPPLRHRILHIASGKFPPVFRCHLGFLSCRGHTRGVLKCSSASCVQVLMRKCLITYHVLRLAALDTVIYRCGQPEPVNPGNPCIQYFCPSLQPKFLWPPSPCQLNRLQHPALIHQIPPPSARSAYRSPRYNHL